jgi:hypothetical protein
MTKELTWGPQNPHPLSQIKTERVWEGKYDQYGRRRQVDTAACDNILLTHSVILVDSTTIYRNS